MSDPDADADATRSAPPGDHPAEPLTPWVPTLTGGGDPSFGGAPGGPPAPDPLPEAPPGYELIEEVGRGGMGVVYKARDRALNRTVAVKMLRGRLPGASAAARRFVQEAQITSQLQHPGIPPVHQVGTLPDGRPFLVMKLVKGRTLQARLNERRSAADRGRLLAVFEQLCQAVGYAHANRVIHRDLKPSNVMVGKFGEVQVMDWGLAKSLADPDPAPAPDAPGESAIRSPRDSDSATETGSVLGTPAYMPPEQAGGELHKIDERSDVFGLGAVLCALLTGEPPYVGPDPGAVALQAIRGHLTGASERLGACGGDPELVALCRRCLSPERDDRPRDANELAAAVADLRAAAEERARAADLDRVRAEAEHREQRERDRVRAEAERRERRERRKVQLALAGAALLAVATGGAFAWWADRHRADLREADLRAQIEDQRRAAERRERLARNGDAVAALLDASENALRADDAPAARLALDQARTRAAEGGADHLADRLARCRADLELLLELDRLGDLRWTLVAGRLQGGTPAAAQLPAALARYGIVPGTTPADEAARRVGDSLVKDHVLTALDRWLAWEPSPEVLAVLRAADPDAFRDPVRDAVAARAPARVAELAGRPAALTQPARYAGVLGDMDAIPLDRRRRLLVAALGPRPGDYRVLVTLGHLCPINVRESADERETWFRAAVAVRPRSAIAHNYLGIALLDKRDLDGAVGALREAVRLDPKYASGYSNLGGALFNRGELGPAAGACREAIRLDPKYPLAHSNLGIILHHQGDLDGAVAACREAVALDPDLAPAQENLGIALGASGDRAGALAAFTECARLAPRSASGLNQVAWILCTAREARLRDGPRALELATRACELSAWKVATYIDTLAAAHAEVGEFEKAVGRQKEALSFPKFAATSGAAARHRLSLYEQGQAYRTPASAVVAPPPRAVTRP